MPKVDDETLRQRYEKAKTDWEERQKANRAKRRREKAQADARPPRHPVSSRPGG